MKRRRFIEGAGAALGGVFLLGQRDSRSTGQDHGSAAARTTGPDPATPAKQDGQGQEEDAEETETPADTGITHVSPDGERGASGTRDDPLDSIYDAVRRAEPGETIHVAAGEYREEIHTQQGGEPGEPITITGPRDAVVRPTLEDGTARQGPILTINHSHVHLRGLAFDGLADPGREGDADWYGDIIRATPEAGQDYLEDLVLMPDAVGNGRSALVSATRVVGAEIGGFEVTGPAGVQHLYDEEDGHNGEIVYLGTAIDNIGEDWYGWDTVDRTRDVHVHHIDNSAGHPHAELVDAKPGTRDILIEYCTDGGGSGAYTLRGHDDTDEAAVGLRGSDATLRYCVIEDGNGQAVQVGVDALAQDGRFEELTGTAEPDAATDAGTGHAIYGNRLTGNDGLAIRFPVDEDGIAQGYGPAAQRHICGNTYDGETHGTPDAAWDAALTRADTIGHTGGQR